MACKVCDKVKCIYRYKVASEFEDGALGDLVIDEAANFCPECGRRMYKETEPEVKAEADNLWLCATSYCGLNLDGRCVEKHAMGNYCNRLVGGRKLAQRVLDNGG